MALPTILINSATGSDSAASGAGPATALTGTAASTNAGGTIVTLDGSPDLSGVATDGSHVIYLADSTAGARNFGKITAADNGAKTVTVANAFGGSLSGKSWAIGGKRASLLGSVSYKLLDNNGTNGDAMAGWIIEMQSGHTETRSSRANIYRAGDTTDGPIIVRGEAGAATRPVLTFSGAGSDIVLRANYHVLRDFTMTGTSSASSCIIDVGTAGHYIDGLKISGFSGVLIEGGTSTGMYNMHVVNCELSGGSVGVKVQQNAAVLGNYIHGQTSHGISGPSANLTGTLIANNIIAGCGGDGINLVQARTDNYSAVRVLGNTIDGCTGDGIDYTGDNDGLSGLTIVNNILSNNGGYGVNFTSLTATKVLARAVMATHNNTYNNTSGACNLSGVLKNDPGLNPTYTNTGGGDYSIGTNLKAKGFPGAGAAVIGLSGSTSYVDVGAVERAEPAAGGPAPLVDGGLVR